MSNVAVELRVWCVLSNYEFGAYASTFSTVNSIASRTHESYKVDRPLADAPVGRFDECDGRTFVGRHAEEHAVVEDAEG